MLVAVLAGFVEIDTVLCVFERLDREVPLR